MMKIFRLYVISAVVCFLFSVTLLAGPKDPVKGADFEKYKQSQNVELQKTLRGTFTEDQGFIVFGPLDPRIENKNLTKYYSSIRILCPKIESEAEGLHLISANPNFIVKKSSVFTEKPKKEELPGYRGTLVEFEYNGKSYTIQFLTIQQLRFLIWAKSNLINPTNPDFIKKLNEYAEKVSDYLYLIDKLKIDAHGPKSLDFNLPEGIGIYAPPPDYVIQGYQNYKDYLHSHAEVETGFTQGVLGFVPTAATFENLKSNAPAIAYPNKERELLQEEFKKFVERGGSLSSLSTLTKDIFENLEPGEYFFAVGLNGNVRFGRELTREEVAKIEETGKKPARANHAFLFPGEPIMTGGAFFIGCEGPGHLEAVTTQSGHYFYSNISSTIREDIAERSNSYFITIGHLFNAFDNLGIDYNGVVISKL